MDRVTQLRRFGAVPTWLEVRVENMTPTQWRLFYDQVEAGAHVPGRIEDTMPKSADGVVLSPALESGDRQLAAIRQWVEWSKIWGEPQWPTRASRPKKTSKPRGVPARANQQRLQRDH